MPNRFLRPLTSAAVLSLISLAAAGHHSVAGEFDHGQRVSLTGVISEIEWINPHIYVHLDVTDDAGNVEQWRLESVPPSYLRKARVTKDMLMRDGSEVTIDAILPHNGTPHLGFVLVINYPDGTAYQLSTTE